ncbi:MAG TPA: response regulator [Pseudolabrys sp.]|jgi:CheY-like chemotaxis protein|nr:response regulator [Pseudolabrys sp.]
MSALRVLHVDDEPDIREVVEMSLALDPGLSVKSCSCGSDALAAAAEWSPHVILMDVMMPEMDGPQTLGHLRERRATAYIPVVFMTARAQSRELAQFLSLGAAGVIPKPFDPMTLAGAVRDYLKRNDLTFGGLRSKFIARAQSDAQTLTDLRRDLAALIPNFERIGSVAHALAGSAGIHGFDDVGVHAHAVDLAAELARTGHGALRDVELALERLLTALAGAVRASGDDMPLAPDH